MPFFLAFGAFGGGLFVASPCVIRVVVCRGVRRRERCAVVAAFVCVSARAVRRCVATCGGGAFVCQRAGGLRRRAPCVFRAVASARAEFRSVFLPPQRRPNYAQRRPVFDAVTHQNRRHDV